MAAKNQENNDAAPDNYLTKNKKVHQYTIIDRLGRGGMGEVYLTRDRKLNRKVALKFLSRDYTSDSKMKDLFMQEAMAAAALNHPNIITIYEVGEYKKRPFIAMEYLIGESLKDLLRNKELPVDRVADIAIQICEGLENAHNSGIIHRDIKSQNIIVCRDDRVKILDFGLAGIMTVSDISDADLRQGTLTYMSPEQVKGRKLDRRSDIFSLGIVLYELITGNLPFQAEYEAAVLYAIVYEHPLPMSKHKKDVPPALQRIVDKALDKRPEERYQVSADMGNDLRLFKKCLKSGETQNHITRTKSIPSIAVLKFSDMSPQKDQEYFCDGMADEITNALTKISDLHVAARTSAFQFKGRELDIRKIGKSLNVDTVLEGSVRKAADRVRITVKLVNVVDGFYIWSEKYDRDVTDVFAIQDEISRAIVEKLKVKFISKIDKPLVKQYTSNLEAYSLYLKGIYFWNRRYEGGLQKGMQYFQQAIALDPTYPLAYAGLADTFNILAFYNFMPPHEACPKARSAAIKALELDADLAEAHTALGWSKTFYEWDWPAAEQEFKRAIDLNPNYAIVHHNYGLYLLAMGRIEEGISEMKRALEFDPLSMIINSSMGGALYFARRYEESIQQYMKALDLDPNFPLAHAFFAGPFVCLSRFTEAIVECQKAGALSGGSNYATAFLGYVYGVSGEEQKARQFLNGLLNLSKSEYVSSYHIALVYIGLDDKDSAFEWLKKAYHERDNWLVWLNVHPAFDSLRSDPRFSTLLKDVGLGA